MALISTGRRCLRFLLQSLWAIFLTLLVLPVYVPTVLFLLLLDMIALKRSLGVSIAHPCLSRSMSYPKG